MVALLLKDLRLQKKLIALGFVVVGFVFFALGALEGIPIAVPAAIFGHFLIVVASKSDEKNNNGRMLASFPLLRRDIVSAKYVGIFMFLAITFLLTLLLRWGFGIIFPLGELPRYNMQSTLMASLVLMVFYSFYFPIYFGTGSRYVQVLDLIVLFALGGITVLALRVLEWMNINVGSSISYMLSLDDWVKTFCIIGSCLVMLILSWCISLYLYERRNL